MDMNYKFIQNPVNYRKWFININRSNNYNNISLLNQIHNYMNFNKEFSYNTINKVEDITKKMDCNPYN